MNVRRRSTMVVATGTAVFAAAVLTGCGSDPDYQGACVDRATQTRVLDSRCDDGGNGGVYAYRMWPVGRRVPPIGGSVAGYPGSVDKLPDGHSATLGGADPRGGTVSRSSTKSAVGRGGFGLSSRHGWSVGG